MSLSSNISILQQQAERMGVSDTLVSYLKKSMNAESGGNVFSKAATSSAKGLFGFTNGTWNEICGRYNLDSSKRFDAATQCAAGIALAQEQAQGLEKILGRAPTEGELYLSHFAGMGGARSILRAEASTPITQLLSAEAISANSMIKFKGKKFAEFTAGDIQDWADAKMNVNMDARLKYQNRHDKGLTSKEEDDKELAERQRIAKQFGFSDKMAGSVLGKIFIAILSLFVGEAQTADERRASQEMNADATSNKSPSITKSKVASVGVNLT